MVDTRFQEQARAFITETLKDVIPDVNVDSGSALNSLLARGGATITAGLMQEIEHVLKSRDLSEPDSLSEADMDLLLENLLTERDGGTLSFGFVRLFYDDRSQRVFEAGLTAANSDRSLTFATLTDLVFAPQDYLLDSRTGYYFINVPFTSEAAGDEYNVDPGEITQLVNDVSNPLRVTNVSLFQNGAPSQTNAQALRSAKRGVSTRTTLTTDGAVFFFQQQFGTKLKDLLVVGNGDDEMLRDELYDLGATADPRFQVGVGSIDPVTREQLGSPQDLHIGGKTDLYMLFDSINYVQQTVDLFADMSLDAGTSAGAASITATILSGTTGVVAASGQLIIELGGASEETVAYTSRVTADNNTFTFTLEGVTSVDHLTGVSVKAVNNSDLSVGVDGDITVLPVFQVAEIRTLDPVTLQPIGSEVPQTTEESAVPGWYFARSNRYDLMSAKETKDLVIDEKSDAALWPGNQALTGVDGGTSNIVIGSETYTLYTAAVGTDFTGYQGREIALSGAISDVTRSIIRVDSATEVVLGGDPLAASASGVDFDIAARFADYNQYPVRLSFYTNTEIAEAQETMDGGSKRIITDDTLVRSFLPVFLDFDLRYRGDGEPADVRERVVEVLKTSSGDAIGESVGARFEYSDLINAAYEDDLANYVETPFEVRIRRQELDGSESVRYVNPGPDTVNAMAVRVAPDVTEFSDDGATTDGSNVFTTAGSLYTFSTTDVGKRIWVEGTGIVTITAFVNIDQVQTDTVFASTSLTRDWSFVASFIEAKLPSTSTSFTVPASGRLFLGGFSDNQEAVDYESVVDLGNDEYTFIIAEDQGIVRSHPVNESLDVSVSDYDPDNVITDGVITDERVYRPFLGNAVITKIGS